MRNILIASTFIFLSLLGTSCKRENTYLVEGVVVNRITQEPLEGVKMTLNDGLGVGGIFPSDEIEVSNVTYTDAAYFGLSVPVFSVAWVPLKR